MELTMNGKLIVKGWGEFQHYKHRNPPWIKMHKSLLDNYDFQCLPIASKALAPMLWLLASESDDGSIDADLDKMAFRLRWNKTDLNLAINSLINKGFIIDASNMLADCKQHALTETETETETEKSKNITQKNEFFADIDSQLLKDYLQVRKAKRAPKVSKTVYDAFVRECSIAKISISEALRVCVERNWVGFKADWYLTSGSVGNKTPHRQKTSKHDELARVAREMFGDKNESRVIDVTEYTTTN